MTIKRLFKHNYILLLLFSNSIFSQELPPIVKYSQNDYSAAIQNWMISQDSNQFMFFANNDGLLEFNGSNWKLYPSPNESIIRSVKVIGDKVFTGCYMEFGYWNRHNDGQLRYTSLSASIKKRLLDEEQFWNIFDYDHWIIFQSLDRLYIYDTKTASFKIVTPAKGIINSFKTKNSVFFHSGDAGLFEIERGKAVLVSDDSIIKNNKIVNVYDTVNGILLQTQLNGFYYLRGKTVTKFTTAVDDALSGNSVYSSYRLTDGSYAVGTVSNGVYLLSKEGKLLYHITQQSGLSNNTVLSLYEDVDKNLWLGLDNGINCVNLKSPVRSYVDNTGVLGTVYTSILHKDVLYIGTNQGLFYKRNKENTGFTFVSNTKGQVWSLFSYDGTLFCGHDAGTFIIDNADAKPIFSKSGTWNFRSAPNRKDILLQGNYDGISVLKKENNKWVFKNKLNGFDYSSKYFEVTNTLEVYVSHEYKGLFRFSILNDFTATSSVFKYLHPTKGKNAGLVKYNNQIYYAYKEGILKLNPLTRQFETDTLLSKAFEIDEYSSGKLIVDNSNRLWMFSKKYIQYFSFSKLGVQLKSNTIPIPASLTNSMLGYENINELDKNVYLIGTTDGYYTINIDDLHFKNYAVSITTISNNKLNETPKSCEIVSGNEFNHKENNFTIHYAVSEYNKYINAEYQYQLKGIQDDWSEWNSKPSISFKNLPPGDYTFQVRARIGSSKPENTAVYQFTILKPWYATNVAIFLYLILGLLLARSVNKAYKSYYKKQQEKLIEENNMLLEIKELENERQLMKLKNEELTQDVLDKNKELAVSTMSLLKKNELLTLIKEDLKKSTEDKSNRSIKSLISTINNNITEKDSWNVFKEAFDTADKDFLKKIKTAHPSLTPNDLRLCAYLRLNLSSKEIAPMINISVRSVEIKRYRLRKKMKLVHEQGLVEYILSI
jgi:AraC family transcriptional regulator, chitin signaling transcriptional activator